MGQERPDSNRGVGWKDGNQVLDSAERSHYRIDSEGRSLGEPSYERLEQLRASERGDGMHDKALAPADRIHLLIGLGLDGNGIVGKRERASDGSSTTIVASTFTIM